MFSKICYFYFIRLLESMGWEIKFFIVCVFWNLCQAFLEFWSVARGINYVTFFQPNIDIPIFRQKFQYSAFLLECNKWWWPICWYHTLIRYHQQRQRQMGKKIHPFIRTDKKKLGWDKIDFFPFTFAISLNNNTFLSMNGMVVAIKDS